jgi:hypothetical protein
MDQVAGIATVVAAVLGIFGMFQWKIMQRQLKLDLMSRVHERYSKLYKELADLPEVVTSTDNLKSEAKDAISAYINLCAEQFHWRKTEKLIDDNVWKVWDAAIGAKLRHPVIRFCWEQNHANDEYYDGFCEYVARHFHSSAAKK